MKLFKKCKVFAVSNNGKLTFCGNGRTITAKRFIRKMKKKFGVSTPIFILNYEKV